MSSPTKYSILPDYPIILTKGGEGSGHFEHAGRPGEVGGSVGGEGGNSDDSISTEEIERWKNILQANLQGKGKDRLRSYLGSLVLGRDFGETSEDYFKRRGLTEFVIWAREQLNII